MLRLSIIIPIYNVETHLEKCLRSLEDQDIVRQEYEIICVNDGSPDNSREIVLKLQEEFNNIILIDQENKGVSLARNVGIDRSKGEYLLFIDPDDYVDANRFKQILGSSEKNQAEVSFLGFTFLDEDGTVRHRVYNERNRSIVYSGTDAYYVARSEGNIDTDRMWAVLFEREFFNRHKLRYLSDVPYLEDGELIARILSLAEKCIFNGQSFYQRTTRPGSATNSSLFYSERAAVGFLSAAINLKQFQQKKDLNQRQIEFLNQPIVKFVALAFSSCFGGNLFSRMRFISFKLKENSIEKCRVEGCDKLYRMYGNAYNYSPMVLMVVLFFHPRFRRIKDKFNL